jgi:hypothetical protein
VKRLVVVLAVGLAALGFAPRLLASASQLAVSPGSITPTMVAPVATLLSMALTNGGTTAGQAENLDRVVLTFPRALDASTLCGTWSAAPTSTQTVSTNNALVVTVVDGGTANDSLTLTASGVCANTIGLGTIDLGSTGFTSGGNLTFNGNGNGGRTTLAYDPSTFQVTVVLGSRGGAGTAATVGSVTATYTPSGALLYGDGTSVAPATATTTGAAL